MSEGLMHIEVAYALPTKQSLVDVSRNLTTRLQMPTLVLDKSISGYSFNRFEA